MSLKRYNQLCMNIISEHRNINESLNPLDLIKNNISKNIKNISDKILANKSYDIQNFISIAQKISPDQQQQLLSNTEKITNVLSESIDINNIIIENKMDGDEDENLQSKTKSIVDMMSFIKDNENVLSYVIPFYDGLITSEELQILPDAIKSLCNGTWGSSLQDYTDLGSVSKTVGTKSMKTYNRLAKTGVKRGGKAVIRLSKRQLSKVSSKIFLKPLTKLVTSLLAKCGIALGGAAITGGTAATGAGLPVAAITGTATVLYIVWVISDLLSAVNDLLKLLVQVHITDQQYKIDVKEDQTIDDYLNNLDIAVV